MSLVNPPPAEKGWLVLILERGLMGLTRLPGWAVPVVLGAAVLFLITGLRGLVLLLSRPADSRSIGFFVISLLVSVAAGAAGGAAYTLIRPPLRKLHAIGDVLTGAILGWIYVFVILLPAKYLFDDQTLNTQRDWLVASLFGIGAGVVASVVYWANRRRRP